MAPRRKQVTGFGPRLRTLREAAGLTQAQLGERAGGMPYQAVAKYEREATEPSWSAVLRLADALGVTPNAFLVASAPGDASKDGSSGKVRRSGRRAATG